MKKENGNGTKSDKETHENTTFEDTFGRICCIGIIRVGSQGIIQKDVFLDEEKKSQQILGGSTKAILFITF